MTGPRLACALLLFLPIACSSGSIHPGLAPVEEDDDDPIHFDPTDVDGFVMRGNAHAARGDYEKAAADYREAIRVGPDEGDGYNSLAWLLATCPKASVRNGKQALELATRACELSSWSDADTLSTLAAAHAECGQFEEAVKWQKKAIKVGFEDEEEADDARKQLKLYQGGKPYREK